jgi:hypothetical protein
MISRPERERVAERVSPVLPPVVTEKPNPYAGLSSNPYAHLAANPYANLNPYAGLSQPANPYAKVHPYAGSTNPYDTARPIHVGTSRRPNTAAL